MITRDWLALITVLLLICVSGFFSAAEIGILSLGKYRLRQLAESGSRAGKILHALMERPGRMLTAILITITAINYTAETIASDWSIERLAAPTHEGGFGWPLSLSLALSVAVVTLLVLIWAEITPITYAAANPERVARWTAAPVHAATLVLALPARLITGLAHLVSGARPAEPFVTEDEIKTIVTMETERGVLEEEEKEMIHSIFAFGDRVAREVMVPRIDIVGVQRNDTIEAALKIAAERGYTRLPVYHASLDHVVGLLHIRDLVPAVQSGQLETRVWRLMRQPYFVPETKKVAELLQELRLRRQSLAIVLDEYGGTAGLVTLEDLLEEIVGEIYDEYDVESPAVQQIAADTYIVDGRMSVHDVEDLLETALPEGDFDTVAGLLYDHVGRVPALGDTLGHEHLTFSVEQLARHRISKVRIKVGPKPADEEEAEGNTRD
jgi:CBS domain containing-hemolysin-like protein